jgi:type I restriction enzyme R subunit
VACHLHAQKYCKLTDNEFKRILEQIIKPDVFKTSKILREINTFEREDGTPLHYTLINIKDWCKNTFEGVNQLRQSRS